MGGVVTPVFPGDQRWHRSMQRDEGTIPSAGVTQRWGAQALEGAGPRPVPTVAHLHSVHKEQKGGGMRFQRFPNAWGLARFKSQGSSYGKRGEGTGLRVGKCCPCVSDSLGLAQASSLSSVPPGPYKKALFSGSRKSCLLAVNNLIFGGRACLGRGVGGQAPSPPLTPPLASGCFRAAGSASSSSGR